MKSTKHQQLCLFTGHGNLDNNLKILLSDNSKTFECQPISASLHSDKKNLNCNYVL